MRRLLAVLAAVLPVLLGLSWAGSATANTIDRFVLEPSATVAGTAVVATGEWTATDTTPRRLIMSMPPELVGKATWVVTQANPTMGCVTGAQTGELSCFWDTPSVGDTAMVKAKLTLGNSVGTGDYSITAKSDPADTNGPIVDVLRVLPAATPTVALNPTSALPGTVVTATGTYTANTTGDIRVGLYLLGTSGQGTYSAPATPPTGLTNCSMDSTFRAYGCTWPSATIGDTRTLALQLNVGAGAVAGQQWEVLACSNPNTVASRCDTTLLTIAGVTTSPSTSTSPTATPTPTGTATASPTASPTITPTPTGPPVAATVVVVSPVDRSRISQNGLFGVSARTTGEAPGTVAHLLHAGDVVATSTVADNGNIRFQWILVRPGHYNVAVGELPSEIVSEPFDLDIYPFGITGHTVNGRTMTVTASSGWWSEGTRIFLTRNGKAHASVLLKNPGSPVTFTVPASAGTYQVRVDSNQGKVYGDQAGVVTIN